MLEQLKAIYFELTGNSDADITPKTKIADGLGLSSLGKVQLVCAIEDHFDIEISAYDEGEMDIAITDFSEIDGKTKRTNFFDVELDGGQVFETGVSGGSASDSGYTLETDGQTVSADVVLYEGDFDNTSVTATAQGNGVTDGSGIYSLGDYAVLRAEPGEGAAFAGWYDESGMLLSRDEVYGFTVKDNLSLTAVFGNANAELTVDKDYVILETTKTAGAPIAAATDSVWNEFITCEVRSDGEEPVIALEDGEITGLRAGTAWIDYTVEIGDRTLMAQSRIDVTDGGNPPEEEIEDVTLRQDQVTVELCEGDDGDLQLLRRLLELAGDLPDLLRPILGLMPRGVHQLEIVHEGNPDILLDLHPLDLRGELRDRKSRGLVDVQRRFGCPGEALLQLSPLLIHHFRPALPLV